MSHLDPIGGAGAGCDLEIRGWGIEGMWDALPEFQPDAAAFLNQDFDSRFGVRFNSWPEICTVMDAENQMPCVSYPSPTSATGTYTDGTTWTIDPFLQGCGSSQFPPNAVWRGDFDDTTSNVQSRCEHFGLNDNPAGGDTYQMYPGRRGWRRNPRPTLVAAATGRSTGKREHARLPESGHRPRWHTDEELVADAVLLIVSLSKTSTPTSCAWGCRR